jgi:hypothetical protein
VSGRPSPFLLSPRRLGWLLLAGAAAASFGVWQLGARPPAWYPPCPFHALTGLNCPGCGSARTVHALAHGEWARALAQNPLLVLLLPLLLFWTGHALWRALRHNLPPVELPRPTAAIMLGVVMAFWVLRNLPWWPFTLLAPQG